MPAVYGCQRWYHLFPESHRHTGSCGFHLRGVRALASCEGALLLVDASQGVEAQTLANLYLALEHDLEIIPVINKIDLPSADIDRVKDQIEEDLGLDPETAILASAKEGTGIDDIMEAVVQHAAPAERGPEAPLEALIFDSHYDPFQRHHRPFPSRRRAHPAGDRIRFMSNNATYRVEEVGVVPDRPQTQERT
jgi:GTP-binding protein LepA